MKKTYLSTIVLLITICFLTSCSSISSTNNISNDVSTDKIDSNNTTTTSKTLNFSSVDLNDNVITQDIFAKKDITVLNIWGTYCSPCINEMPELATWSKELPDNVQIIGLVIDVDAESKYNIESAIKIVKSTGADYTHILYNESLQKLLENVMAIPTTMFIDKNGNILGDAIVGAYVDEYKKRLEKHLNE